MWSAQKEVPVAGWHTCAFKQAASFSDSLVEVLVEE